MALTPFHAVFGIRLDVGAVRLQLRVEGEEVLHRLPVPVAEFCARVIVDIST